MRLIKLLLITLALTTVAAAECLTVEEAAKKIGENVCVTGTVVKVGESKSGNFYLDFCKNYRECPLTVFIPARNVRDVGDVRQLEGKTIEVHGKVEQYNGRAEIILKDIKQLKGDASKIPPMPKNFDAERKGGFSAGKFSSPKSGRTPHGQPPVMPGSGAEQQ